MMSQLPSEKLEAAWMIQMMRRCIGEGIYCGGTSGCDANNNYCFIY